MREAFRQLRSDRPRPVEIEIPPDTLGATADVQLLDPAAVERAAGDPDLLKQAAEALRKAARPLICVGGGVLSSGAWDEVRALAEMLEAPVVMSSNARGALSDRHYLGQNGLAGQRLLPEADVVLAVGTRFVHPKEWGVPAGATVIRIDADEREVQRQPNPTIGIVGDAKAAVAALVAQVDGIGPRPSREQELNALKESVADTLFELQPQAVLRQRHPRRAAGRRHPRQ